MTATQTVRTAAGAVAGGAALAALGYAALAAAAWTQYGHASEARDPEARDPLLDGFMPIYDIVERHHVRVSAPAAVTLAAARDLDPDGSPIVRAIFRGRELLLGADPAPPPAAGSLLKATLSIGWGILADHEGREIVLGAVTKPWEPNPAFRDLLPRDFPIFAEPGCVKIAWTLRADPIGASSSIFRTETRAIATDAAARAKFRRYWAMVSPGVRVIRYAMLAPIKREAERRAAGPAGAPMDAAIA
jgi:hypothetical protein